MLEDAQRLAGEGHMDEADALLTRLERDVALGEDVSAKGGLERGMGSDEPEWLSRVAEYIRRNPERWPGGPKPSP